MIAANRGFTHISLVFRCRTAIKEAIWLDHNAYFVAPHETMNIQSFVERFQDMPRDDARRILTMLDQDENNKPFTTTIRGVLDIW